MTNDTLRSKSVTTRKGIKNFTQDDKDKIKSVIRSRMKFRDTNEELLEKIEDKGFNIGETKLREFKNEIRNEMGKRFEEIGTYELMEEHDIAVQTIKMLLKKYNSEFNSIEDPIDRTRVGQEIRNSLQDLMSLYSKAEVVQQVLKYFEEEYGEKKDQQVEKVGKKVKGHARGDLFPRYYL